MNAAITSKENNTVKFTFQVGPEKFEEGVKFSYNKNKGRINLPGFRKGKAPRKLIEAQFGEDVFYDDAINYVLGDEYEIAVGELGLDVVSRPEIDAPSISKEDGVSFEVTVTVKPDVTLGQYKGLEVEKTLIEVSEEELLNEIKKVQEQNSRIVTIEDRVAKDGDIVNISYSGTVDGVLFDGGQSDSHDLTLGSNSFIDGFEQQIVGHSIGDRFDVNVTFPTEYHANELAGKDAVFAVEVKGISVRELPELNDEFAQDVSDFETIDEYKASIVDKIKAEKEKSAETAKRDSLLDQVVANATMDVPEVMVENKIDQMVGDFENNISQQGLSLDVYCQYMGTTKEQMRDGFKDTADKSVKARLVLEQIVKDERLELTREELDAEIEKIGEGYGLEPGKMLEIIRDQDRKSLKEDTLVQRAIKILEESSIEVEKKDN